ncbi:MAG: site-specific integrase [Pseudomonadota bacterium]
MHEKIKGIHRVKSRPLADGTVHFYYYTHRGGSKFWTAINRPAPDPMPAKMVAAYRKTINDEKATRRTIRQAQGTIDALITDYKESNDYLTAAKDTRRMKLSAFDQIADAFGPDEITVFTDPQMRGDVKAWHRRMRSTPRQADIVLGELITLLNFAIDEGKITAHVCNKIKRLYVPTDHADEIIEPEIFERMIAEAGFPFVLVLHFAYHFGLRRKDLAELPIGADKGDTLETTTSKSRGRRQVILPITRQSRVILDRAHAVRKSLTETIHAENPKAPEPATLLVNSRGRAWTPDGIGTNYDKLAKKVGVDRRLHDFRGNAITHFCRAGFSDEEIAEFAGWSKDNITKIRRKYVSKRNIVSAAIARLERADR